MLKINKTGAVTAGLFWLFVAWGGSAWADAGFGAGQSLDVKEFLREARISHGVIFSGPCGNEAETASDGGSSQRAYFELLLKRGESAPIEDFLKLWKPDSPTMDNDPYFFACEEAPWRPIFPHIGNQLVPRCKPDVLYSWGPIAKLESIKNSLQDGQAWSGKPNPGYALYTSLAPAATFMYGLIQIRLKIKPSTDFTIAYSPVRPMQGIDVYGDINRSEFRINDASAIESWSYGTPEQYDEIVRDIVRIRSGKRALVYSQSFPERLSPELRLYGGLDGHPGTEKILKGGLLSLIQMILNDEGRIYYSRGTCRNRREFFATDRPTYFNPYLSTN